MTLEEFARARSLPPRWLQLRQKCEALVRDSNFWSQREMQEAARKLATKASDILHGTQAQSALDGQCDKHPNKGLDSRAKEQCRTA